MEKQRVIYEATVNTLADAAATTLVRDGKIVAFVCPAAQPNGSTGTLADWMGTGSGFTLAPGASLDDPAFEPEEWEDLSTDS